MPPMEYSPFTSLQTLVRQRDARERCDLCGLALASGHQHLIEPAARKLLCACDACALLFHSPTETKYKRVPRDVRLLSDFQMTDTSPSTPNPATVTLVVDALRGVLLLLSGAGVTTGTTITDSQLLTTASGLVGLFTIVWSLWQQIQMKRRDHEGSVISAEIGKPVQPK